MAASDAFPGSPADSAAPRLGADSAAALQKHLVAWKNLQETQITSFENIFQGVFSHVETQATIPHRLAQLEAQATEYAKMADSLDVLERQLQLRMGDVETMVAKRFENFADSLSQAGGGDGEPASEHLVLKVMELEQRLMTQERNNEAMQRDFMNAMREAAREEAVLQFKREQARARKLAAKEAARAAASSTAEAPPTQDPVAAAVQAAAQWAEQNEAQSSDSEDGEAEQPQPVEVVEGSAEEAELVAASDGESQVLSRRTSAGGTTYVTRSTPPSSTGTSRPTTADEPAGGGPQLRLGEGGIGGPKVRRVDAYGDPQYATQIRTLRRSFVKTQDELRKNNEVIQRERQEVLHSQSALKELETRVKALEDGMQSELRIVELQNTTCELAGDNRELQRKLDEMGALIAELQRPKPRAEDEEFKAAVDEVAALADAVRNSNKRLAPNGVVMGLLDTADSLLVDAASDVEAARGSDSTVVLKHMQALLLELRMAARPNQMLQRKDKELLGFVSEHMKRAIKALMDALSHKISTSNLDLRLRDLQGQLDDKTDARAVSRAIEEWSQGDEMQARFNAFQQQLEGVAQDLVAVREMINTVEQGAADPRTVKIIAKNLETANQAIVKLKADVKAKADREHLNRNLLAIQDQMVNLQRLMPQLGDLVERLDAKADAGQLRRLQRVVEYTHLAAEEFAPLGATRCISCNRPASVGGAQSSPPGSLRAAQLFGPGSPSASASLSGAAALGVVTEASPAARGNTLVDALSVSGGHGAVPQTSGNPLAPSDVTFSPFPKLSPEASPVGSPVKGSLANRPGTVGGGAAAGGGGGRPGTVAGGAGRPGTVAGGAGARRPSRTE